MKRILVLILTAAILLSMTACNPFAKQKKTIPTETLNQALSQVRYYSSPFSITLGKLINYAMDDYKITYMTGKESIEKGYNKESDFDESINMDYFYYAIISGETMLNPDLPYMTEYEDEAAKAWLYFDEDHNLLASGVELCSNLETCAILLMVS